VEGGARPESIIAYYRLIIAKYREIASDDTPPGHHQQFDVTRRWACR
jgi:hypothetical protein